MSLRRGNEDIMEDGVPSRTRAAAVRSRRSSLIYGRGDLGKMVHES